MKRNGFLIVKNSKRCCVLETGVCMYYNHKTVLEMDNPINSDHL